MACKLALLTVAVVAFLSLQMTVAQTIPGFPTSCDIIFNSPQFALLCNVTNPDLPAPLTLLNQMGIVSLAAYSPNQICDLDCRCIMGATARGGRCGRRASDNQIYCLCDYNQQPPRAASYPVLDLECRSLMNGFKACAGNPADSELERACNADCTCSHGYPANNGSCTVNSAVSGDPVGGYCFCGNGQNIAGTEITE